MYTDKKNMERLREADLQRKRKRAAGLLPTAGLWLALGLSTFVSAMALLSARDVQEDMCALRDRLWEARHECDSLAAANREQEELLEIAGYYGPAAQYINYKH